MSEKKAQGRSKRSVPVALSALGVGLLARPRKWIKSIVGLWGKSYEDFRIILEQSGHVHYFYIHGKTQQLMVRAAMVLSVVVMVFVAAFVQLWWRNQQLENSHQKVYNALLMASSEERGQLENTKLTEEQMIYLAESIRERDSLLKEYIAETETLVAQSNESLSSQLLATGLNEKRLNKDNNATGGIPRDLSSEAASILNQQMLLELEKNRKLKEILTSLPKEMPVLGSQLTSGYGVRIHPVTKKPDFHSGLDFRPVNSHQTLVTKAGTVVFAGYYGNYGNTVIVDHGQGIRTLYAHLKTIDVKVNDVVEQGQKVGIVGTTGLSTGVHLHYEIIVDGKPINPAKVIEFGKQYVRN